MSKSQEYNLLIKPSEKLFKYWTTLRALYPSKINSINLKRILTTSKDINFINSLPVNSCEVKQSTEKLSREDLCLNLEDIQWLYEKLSFAQQRGIIASIYFHEIFMGSEIILPKYIEPERNEILEKRCQKLRVQQQNRWYRKVTKTEYRVSEETVSNELKKINRYLILIGQLIITVVSGFFFGLFGTEWIIGDVDLGARILCGIFIAIVVASAELYYLLKHFNEAEL